MCGEGSRASSRGYSAWQRRQQTDDSSPTILIDIASGSEHFTKRGRDIVCPCGSAQSPEALERELLQAGAQSSGCGRSFRLIRGPSRRLEDHFENLWCGVGINHLLV